MPANAIRAIVPVALAETMAELTSEFARATGHRFEIVHRLNPEVPAYFATGAGWDIALTNPEHVAAIVASGRGDPASVRPFGRSALALAVRGPATAPVARSREGIAALLRATSDIAITDVGTSGAKFRALAAALGVREAIEGRIVPMPGGGPMRALLTGAVEMAALPLTNVAPVPGVIAVALCPPGLGVHIDLSLCVRRNAPHAARAFAGWLVDPARDARLERLGARRFQPSAAPVG